jgi:hypothetical protein
LDKTSKKPKIDEKSQKEQIGNRRKTREKASLSPPRKSDENEKKDHIGNNSRQARNAIPG